LLGAAMGRLGEGNWSFASNFDPETHWSQCGVLLEEIVRAKGLFGACELLNEGMFRTSEADEENVRPAICEAWCVMKEGEA